MKRKTTISLTEIQKQLAAFREEVAAPRDFRSRILTQLAKETGQAAPESGASIWRRMIDFVSRPMLVPALASAAALAFGLWFATRPAGQPMTEAAPIAAAQTALKPKAVKAVQVAKSVPAPAALQSSELPGSSAVQAPAPAGNAPQASASSQNKFSALPSDGPSAAGLPTHEAEPTAAPSQGLAGSSQVRRNRFLASRGEYAAILFKLKAPGRARIEVYDRKGMLVAVLHDAEESAGTFEVRWHGHNQNGQMAPTGIYAVRIMTGEYNDTHKIVLVR